MTKVVVCVPFGRRRYASLLIPQLLSYRPYIDEIRLWMNTNNEDDIKYAKSLESDFIKLEYLPDGVEASGCGRVMYLFYKNCQDENIIYIKIDDDVVLLDDVDSFKRYLDFRKTHPEYFLVFATILNNAIVTHLQQKNGNIPIKKGKEVQYNCSDHIGLCDPYFAENLHNLVIHKHNLKEFYIPNHIVENYARVSINFISWFGSDFKKFNGDVSILGDEEDLTTIKSKELSKNNCIYGEYACVHFSFGGPQREYLDKTNLINDYKLMIFTSRVKHVKSASELSDIICSLGLNYDSRNPYDDYNIFQKENENKRGLWQHPLELATFLWEMKDIMIEKNIKSYIDIGTCSGYTYFAIREFLKAHVNPNLKSKTIDIVPDYIESDILPYIEADFQKATIKDIKESYDFVFIDGLHEHPGPINDFEAIKSTAKIACFHDVRDKYCVDVVSTFNTLSDTYNHKVFSLSKTGNFGIGVIFIE